MNPELSRLLRPKITPQAALRMYQTHIFGIATTNATLGLLWWGAYFETWNRVMFPKGGK